MRAVEVFHNGQKSCMSTDDYARRALLEIVPVPELDELNSDSNFRAQEIVKEEFESYWNT